MPVTGDIIRETIVQVVKTESVIYRDMIKKVSAICGCQPCSVKKHLKVLRNEGYVSKSGKYFEWHEVPLEIDPNLEKKVIVRKASDCKVSFDRSYWTSLLDRDWET